METTTCTRCNGSGHHSYNPRHGTVCYGCNGTGTAAARKPRASRAVVRPLPATRRIADICAGDPTKLDPSNTRALDYLGLTADDLAHYADLWREGVREVAR